MIFRQCYPFVVVCARIFLNLRPALSLIKKNTRLAFGQEEAVLATFQAQPKIVAAKKG